MHATTTCLNGVLKRTLRKIRLMMQTFFDVSQLKSVDTVLSRAVEEPDPHCLFSKLWEFFVFFFRSGLNLIHQHVEVFMTFKVTEWLVQSSNLWYWEPMSCAKVRVKGDGWGGGTGECAKLIYLLVEVSCITLTTSSTSWTCSNLLPAILGISSVGRFCRFAVSWAWTLKPWMHRQFSGSRVVILLHTSQQLEEPWKESTKKPWYGIVEHHYASSR